MEALPFYIQRQQIEPAGIRREAQLPYDLSVEHVAAAMNDVLDYIHHINRVSTERSYERLEELMLGNIQRLPFGANREGCCCELPYLGT